MRTATLEFLRSERDLLHHEAEMLRTRRKIVLRCETGSQQDVTAACLMLTNDRIARIDEQIAAYEARVW